MGPLSLHPCRLAIAGLLLWTCLACQAPAAPDASPRAPDAPAAVAAPLPVRLSPPGAGLGHKSIYVARRNGYFADEGLDMDVLTLTTGGGPDTQALIAGDVQFSATAATILISA